MKTKEEILQRLDEIENDLFRIDMIDHWEDNTSKKYVELKREKVELELELEKIENE